MHEVGIDISHHHAKSVDDMRRSGIQFAYVVTVCDATSAERCPLFPADTQRLPWSFPDPSALTGTPEQRMERVREIRDLIQRQIQQWCEEECRGFGAA